MNSVLLGWVATAYLLASAVFLVPCGKGADLYGRKRFFTCGILIFTLSSIGTLVATSPWMLIGSRVLSAFLEMCEVGFYSFHRSLPRGHVCLPRKGKSPLRRYCRTGGLRHDPLVTSPVNPSAFLPPCPPQAPPVRLESFKRKDGSAAPGNTGLNIIARRESSAHLIFKRKLIRSVL
jgi:hypothetical protein